MCPLDRLWHSTRAVLRVHYVMLSRAALLDYDCGGQKGFAGLVRPQPGDIICARCGLFIIFGRSQGLSATEASKPLYPF